MSKKREIYLLLPDIRSGFNVGSFFRTADGLGVSKIFLTGFTPYPPHKEISKTALDADSFVPWQYFLNPLEIIKKLKNENVEIVCLEKTKDSILIEDYQPLSGNICLICGNEIGGIPQEILDLADQIVAIKMLGKKESFNVSVAGGIALYEIFKKIA